MSSGSRRCSVLTTTAMSSGATAAVDRHPPNAVDGRCLQQHRATGQGEREQLHRGLCARGLFPRHGLRHSSPEAAQAAADQERQRQDEDHRDLHR